MNLKPNLWTVLFVLALIASYFLYTPPPTIERSLEMTAADCKCTIDSANFRTYYGDYITRYYDNVIQDTSLAAAVGFDSLGIRAYTLADQELEHMYNVYTVIYNMVKSAKVYVYPIIKDDEFDLVFRVVGPENKEYFFDFTEPCPTVCENVPYIK